MSGTLLNGVVRERRGQKVVEETSKVGMYECLQGDIYTIYKYKNTIYIRYYDVKLVFHDS